MKKFLKTGVVLFVLVCLLASMSVNASAYVLLGGELVGGITNITYSTQTITTLETLQAINASIEDWKWHLNDAVEGVDLSCYFVQSYSYSVSSMPKIYFREIPVVYYLGQEVAARTDLYDADGNVYTPFSPINGNWVRTEIFLSQKEFSKLSFDLKKSTVSHEIGHVFGLAHNPTDNGTLMYPTIENCTAFVPTFDDIQGVNEIYG